MRILLMVVIFMSFKIEVQAQIEDRHPDSFIAKCGMDFYKGDYIKFGEGTMPTGDYSTISISGKSLMRTVSANNAYNANSNSLSKDWKGFKEKIIRFDVVGSERVGYKTYAIISANGAIRYMIDIDAAIEKGEIVVPEKYRPKKIKSNGSSEYSSADEIIKYKKLMDDGVITKEEFEEKKRKILSE